MSAFSVESCRVTNCDAVRVRKYKSLDAPVIKILNRGEQFNGFPAVAGEWYGVVDDDGKRIGYIVEGFVERETGVGVE